MSTCNFNSFIKEINEFEDTMSEDIKIILSCILPADQRGNQCEAVLSRSVRNSLYLMYFYNYMQELCHKQVIY